MRLLKTYSKEFKVQGTPHEVEIKISTDIDLDHTYDGYNAKITAQLNDGTLTAYVVQVTASMVGIKGEDVLCGVLASSDADLLDSVAYEGMAQNAVDDLNVKISKLLGVLGIETEKQIDAEWGFDLTYITSTNWKKVLSAVGITEKPVRNDEKWVWSAKGIKIHTGNNPITGTYGTPGARKSEKGYASYIGIYGNAELVKNAATTIKTLAEFIKEETPNSSRFI